MQDIFFIIQDSLPPFTKKDVDRGDVPVELSRTCDFLRTVFFLSNKMRKNRDLVLHFIDPATTLKFKSRTLRYLGPDERSMLMLVIKALDARCYSMKRDDDLHVRFVESTPGVLIARGATVMKVLLHVINEHRDPPAYIVDFHQDAAPPPVRVTVTGDLLSFIRRRGKLIVYPPSLDPIGWVRKNLESEKKQPDAPSLNRIELRINKEITEIKKQITILNVLEDNLTVGNE
ncbi:MAG: hypothetical protein ACTSUE_19655 [Promethearchaeota archaeon]